MVFSPQGSQAVGMGQALANVSPAARESFLAADEVLGWSVSRLAWHGPEEALNDTRQTQPCLLATSIACLRALEEVLAARGERLEAAFVAGHSVGEYAALVAAGVLGLEDALRLVARRGELMADAGVPGGMTAVIGLDRAVVAAVVADMAVGEALVVANDNAPGQVVISGEEAPLSEAAVRLRAAGARRVIPLNVSGPFHTPMMSGVGASLGEASDMAQWQDADPPMISNVTAEPVRGAAEIRALLARQVSAPVEWVASVRRMAAEGVDTFVECGPGGALAGMIRDIVPKAMVLTVSDPATLALAAKTLLGARAKVSV
ncbi:MAG: ACP S-malonyltransferase [Chloroflexota bacterium]|nr:ACP S-malonyltransferase [Chloroflexota bacterium]